MLVFASVEGSSRRTLRLLVLPGSGPETFVAAGLKYGCQSCVLTAAGLRSKSGYIGHPLKCLIAKTGVHIGGGTGAGILPDLFGVGCTSDLSGNDWQQEPK